MTATIARSPDRRFDVLDLPLPGAGRYGILLVTLLAMALFAATSCYAALFGTPWEADLVRCAAATAACHGVEPLLRVLPVAAAIVVTVGAGLVMLLVPSVTAARRGIQPVGARFPAAQERLTALAHEMHLRTPPTLMGGPGVRDAFCLGRPGARGSSSPTALLVRPKTTEFDVIVRHELAHVRQRDVALAGLARCMWWALAPLLALVVPLALLGGHAALLRATCGAQACSPPSSCSSSGRSCARASTGPTSTPPGAWAEASICSPACRTPGPPASGRFSGGIPTRTPGRAALREPRVVARVRLGEAVGTGFLAGPHSRSSRPLPIIADDVAHGGRRPCRGPGHRRDSRDRTRPAGCRLRPVQDRARHPLRDSRRPLRRGRRAGRLVRRGRQRRPGPLRKPRSVAGRRQWTGRRDRHRRRALRPGGTPRAHGVAPDRTVAASHGPCSPAELRRHHHGGPPGRCPVKRCLAQGEHARAARARWCSDHAARTLVGTGSSPLPQRHRARRR